MDAIAPKFRADHNRNVHPRSPSLIISQILGHHDSQKELRDVSVERRTEPGLLWATQFCIFYTRQYLASLLFSFTP
ncbi:hypothetical protein J6590_008527 [Homalodisca vitripennis]|nr:hypothetical protein J6590_008527 [Homalodisca vitripennis]